MSYWLSIVGLGLLQFIWLKGIFDLFTDKDLPKQWVLDEDTPPDALPNPAPSLSIIVPARNEAKNIEACVRAALAIDWPASLEVIVLDDRSTDGTGEILARLASEDDRVRVLDGVELPAGWLGKPHALHRAQAHATGDWLFFIDADVTLDPLGPRRIIGRSIEQGVEMSSAMGRLVVKSFWERVVQTRMGAIIAGGNPLAEVNDPEHERMLAVGQCLVFSRAAYTRLGGHESIKASVLDDVDFGKRANAEGEGYRLYYGPGVFTCRMYESLSEIWNGWTKNLFPALGYSVITTAIVTFLLFCLTLLPFVLLAKNAILMGMGHEVLPSIWGLELGICLAIFVTDIVGHVRRGYRWGLFWTFPLGFVVLIAVFWNSAWRIKSGRGAVWKGRIVEAGIPHTKDPSG